MDHLGLLLDISEINLALSESSSIRTFLGTCVELIAKHLDASACSIYLFDANSQTLKLSATHGLNRELVDKVTLKLGEGLTGKALDELRTINVRESSKNPGYKFVPGLFEERFDAFCAVPILRGIQRIGVLVVQRESTEPFTENDERTMRGVVNQLAAIIEYSRILVTPPSVADAQANKKPLKFIKGKPASIGFAHAPLIVDNKLRSLKDLEKDVSTWNCTHRDFLNAIEKLSAQLSSFQARIEEQLADGASLIFAAHLMVLKDEQFVGKIEKRIAEGLNPGLAIIEITEEYCSLFSRSPAVYLREKSDDIRDLGVRLLGFMRPGEAHADDIGGKIVVSRDLLISDILIMAAHEVAGIILVGGGASSHLSILARSCKIPLIIADEEELLDLDKGTMVLMDAELGNIYINPGPEIVAPFTARNRARAAVALTSAGQTPGAAVTADGIRIYLMANVNLATDANNARDLGADGVGLYRTEFPFIIRTNFPTEDEQHFIYKKLLAGLPGKEVTFRTLDVGGDKVLSYYHTFKEQNPFLGMRSLRFCLQNQPVFKQQLRAILRAGVGANARIMFPMISSVDEFDAACSVVNQCMLELASENLPYIHDPAIGIMVEIPSVLGILDDLAAKSDFISIGTNDFIQYMLAVDRTNEKVSQFYCPHHPSVLRGINQVAQAAMRHGIGISICGDMAHNPVYAEFFIGIGIFTLSVEPTYIPSIRAAVCSMNLGEAKRKAQEVLACATIKEIEHILKISG
jgi:phosphotransferase system enzyme I (PtsP)